MQNEGYDVAIVGGYLLIRHVPYVTEQCDVAYGILAFPLSLSGDTIQPPSDHTARFIGSTPCTHDGAVYAKIINGTVAEIVSPGVEATTSFSCKPSTGAYTDFYDKAVTYVAILTAEAVVLEPEATAQVYPPVATDGTDDSVFRYIDTASSRAGLNGVNGRLRNQRVAIVGLGGTGSHILDLVSKTWVKEIHLYDGDHLHLHNAFRMPGVPTKAELESGDHKVAVLASQQATFRSGVVAHPYPVEAGNVTELEGLDFVFLALTDGEAKKVIVDALEDFKIPFIDCGMGIYKAENALAGQIRVTSSTSLTRAEARRHMAFTDGERDEYSQNIQIAELNALNAVLAVIKWKKMTGFYLDLDDEYNTVYVIDGNITINDTKDVNGAHNNHS